MRARGESHLFPDSTLRLAKEKGEVTSFRSKMSGWLQTWGRKDKWEEGDKGIIRKNKQRAIRI